MTEEEFYALNLKKGDFIKVVYTPKNKQIEKKVELKSERLTEKIDTTYINEKGKTEGTYLPPEILYVGDNPSGHGIPLWQVQTLEKIY